MSEPTTLKEALMRAKNADTLEAFVSSLDASGFVVVPKEATDEMLSKTSNCPIYWLRSDWRLMIDARPTLDDE